MAITIDADSCIGCGACLNACPLELIELVDNIATLTDEAACIDCGACVDSCPLGVISL